MTTFLDVDSATAALISQLVLEDIDDIRSQSKGKAPESSPPSSEEYALQLFAEEAQQTLVFLQDLELARSIDRALELDQPSLALLTVVEDGARDDRRYAEALQNHLPPPAQSRAQRLMEDISVAPLSGYIGRGATDSNSLDAENEAQHADAEANEMVLTQGNETHYGYACQTDAAGASNTAAVAEKEARDADIEDEIVSNQANETNHHAQCVICRDRLLSQAPTSFAAPCGHFYCRDCLSDLARACIGDESLFPLQCCPQPLPIDGPHSVFAQLEPRLEGSFREKAIEFGTPSTDRVYCSQPTCSVFLGSTTDHSGDIHCASCGTDVCVSCKQNAHPGEMCGENEALELLNTLAQEQRWQTCPGCSRIIDLQQGCFHMTCRCRTQFCYVCAALWKNCRCPQWEEARLITTARERVENGMGARARVVDADVFQRRVQERVERLRYDHDCANGHRWRRRDGRARCNECHYRLPDYLLLCKSCGIAVCVRCARNRL